MEDGEFCLRRSQIIIYDPIGTRTGHARYHDIKETYNPSNTQERTQDETIHR